MQQPLHPFALSLHQQTRMLAWLMDPEQGRMLQGLGLRETCPPNAGVNIGLLPVKVSTEQLGRRRAWNGGMN